jgi:biotin operon repressor
MTDTFEVRGFRNGEWYRIHKAIPQHFAPKIKALGLAVYNCLASYADTEQRCYPSQMTIAEQLGYSRASISRSIKTLERHQLIRIEKRRGMQNVYYLLDVTCSMGENHQSRRRELPVAPVSTNKSKRTTINNNWGDIKQNGLPNVRAPDDFRPQTREELLAVDIAQGLGDSNHISTYLPYAMSYPEAVLREILSKIKDIPSYKIKKSRIALFKYFINKYDQGTKHRFGD